MSVKYATPLHLEFKRSKLFDLYIYAVFFISIICIYLLPLVAGIKILLLLVSSVACIFAYKTQGKIHSVVWQENNYCLLRRANATIAAELTDSSFVISWLVILHFTTDSGHRCSRLICYDSLDSDLFRQLKVRLKVARLTHSSRASISL